MLSDPRSARSLQWREKGLKAVAPDGNGSSANGGTFKIPRHGDPSCRLASSVAEYLLTL